MYLCKIVSSFDLLAEWQVWYENVSTSRLHAAGGLNHGLRDAHIVGFVVVKKHQAFPMVAFGILHGELVEEPAEHPFALRPLHGHPDPWNGDYMVRKLHILHHLGKHCGLFLSFDEDQRPM